MDPNMDPSVLLELLAGHGGHRQTGPTPYDVQADPSALRGLAQGLIPEEKPQGRFKQAMGKIAQGYADARPDSSVARTLANRQQQKSAQEQQVLQFLLQGTGAVRQNTADERGRQVGRDAWLTAQQERQRETELVDLGKATGAEWLNGVMAPASAIKGVMSVIASEARPSNQQQMNRQDPYGIVDYAKMTGAQELDGLSGPASGANHLLGRVFDHRLSAGSGGAGAGGPLWGPLEHGMVAGPPNPLANDVASLRQIAAEKREAERKSARQEKLKELYQVRNSIAQLQQQLGSGASAVIGPYLDIAASLEAELELDLNETASPQQDPFKQLDQGLNALAWLRITGEKPAEGNLGKSEAFFLFPSDPDQPGPLSHWEERPGEPSPWEMQWLARYMQANPLGASR